MARKWLVDCFCPISSLNCLLMMWRAALTRDLVMIKLMFGYISINIPGKIIIWFRSQPSANQRAVFTFLTNEGASHLSPVVAEYARCCLSTTLLSHCDLNSQSEARVRGCDQSEARHRSPLTPWQPLYSACYQILLMNREMRKKHMVEYKMQKNIYSPG